LIALVAAGIEGLDRIRLHGVEADITVLGLEILNEHAAARTVHPEVNSVK
jgi:hypothetical protein